MTATERRRLAQAARALAGEYAEGRGPKLDPADWCGCAAGHALRRAGMLKGDRRDRIGAAYGLDSALGLLLTQATWLQVAGVDYDSGMKHTSSVPGAVVFPLLYVADLLEAQDG